MVRFPSNDLTLAVESGLDSASGGWGGGWAGGDVPACLAAQLGRVPAWGLRRRG